jgi:hypothetical protein
MIKNILGVILILSACVFAPAKAQVDTLFHLVYGSYNDDALALERANELTAKGYKPFVVPAGEFNRVVFLTVGSKAEAIKAIEKVPGSWFYREEVPKGTASKQTGFRVSVEPSDEASAPEIGSPESQTETKEEKPKTDWLKPLRSAFKKLVGSVFVLPILALLSLLLLLIFFRKKIIKIFSGKKSKKINSPYKCNEIVLVGRTQVNLMQTLFRRNYGFQVSFNLAGGSFSEQFTLAQISLQKNPGKNALKSHLPLNKKTKIADFYQRFNELFGFEVKIVHIDSGNAVNPEDSFKEASDKGYAEKLAKEQGSPQNNTKDN